MADQGEAKPDQTALGIGIILASVLTMAFADAMVKFVSADMTIWQIFFARSLFGIPVLWGLALAGGVSLRLRVPFWTLFRSLLLLLCWLALYASYSFLTLSVAAVAVYTNPIITTLLSAALIGERVTGRQWVGVLLGFLGVLAIIKPGADTFSWAVILPLIAAVFYSLAMIVTRTKCRDEVPLTLALTLHGVFLVSGAMGAIVLAVIGLGADVTSAFPFLLSDWAPMGLWEWGVMALLGLLSAAYFMGVARAYQIAPPQIIGTFDYAYLVSAALWGYLLFSEVPDAWIVGGMILITLAGLLVSASASKKSVPN